MQNRTHNFRALVKGARRIELVTNTAGADGSTLYLYGVIGDDGWGDGISAIDFAKQLTGASGDLHVRLNSPGGDVFEGRAMAQAIREYPGNVTVHVDGIAASAATFLCCAADDVVMAKGAMMMIHNAWSVVGGNSEDLLQAAALLEKIDGQIADSYAAKTGVTAVQARAWMAAETWFTETEAVDAKLANSIAEDKDGSKARAAWDLSVYDKAPPAPKPDDAAEQAKALLEEEAEAAVARYLHAKRRAALL